MKKIENDILLINKPPGITSYDVVRKLKKRYHGQKLGHAGTLDPLASGLMIIGIGMGTKKLKDLIGLPKTYVVKICIGKKTATGDTQGEVVERTHIPIKITREDVLRVVEGLHGIVRLPIPLYSAIKYKGERLYNRARRGEELEQPYGDMEIHKIALLNLYKEEPYWLALFDMEVGSGTYIRSIAEEIGKRLGYPSTTISLIRTKVGGYSLNDVKTL